MTKINPKKISVQMVERVQSGEIFTYLVIKNRGDVPLEGNWRLYSSMGLTPIGLEKSISKTELEGRFGYISPNTHWRKLAQREEIRIQIDNWLLSGMQLLSRQGFYLTELKDGKELLLGEPCLEEPVLAPLTEPRMGAKVFERKTLESRKLGQKSAHPIIIPTPKKVEYSKEITQIDGIKIETNLNHEEKKAVNELIRSFGTDEGSYCLDIKKNSKLEYDYQLETRAERASLEAQSFNGIVWGLHTFRQILSNQDGLALPLLKIIDSCTLEYRGLMIDLARHFHGPKQIKKIVESMASYKMNRLQLGISNDEGWRLQILSIPELTNIGSRRSHQQFNNFGERRALSPAWGDSHFDTGGFFTHGELVDLLKFSKLRGVEIILEINLPGHSNAILRSLENSNWQLTDQEDRSEHTSAQGYKKNIINVGCEDTYRFLETVIREIKDLYDQAGVEFKAIHLGGDEVPVGAWLESPICHSLDTWDSKWDITNLKDRSKAREALMQHFYQRAVETVSEIAANASIGFWHEMANYSEKEIKNCYATVWLTNEDRSEELQKIEVNQLPFIICNSSYYYLDMPYCMAPDEPGLPWASYVDTEDIYKFNPFTSWEMSEEMRVLAIGLQAQLWSETVTTSKQMDYYLFPRLISFAERAWNPGCSSKDWDLFLEAIRDRELDWLKALQISYRPMKNDVSLKPNK
ncbi:MAG: beta-N-acetylhexosaminidase [Candidatus Azotimanducaceae bacterium]